MKQVEVSILGQVYVLGCPEGGQAQLATAVAAVDKEMTAIRDSGRVKARERIAVLAALNLAYQLAETSVASERVAGASAGQPATDGAAANRANSAAGSVAVPNASPALDGLLRRVDAALADDGQLL